ncbi:DUF4030 domain-containing protein [Virgibacillus ndiopensis]|uniref:DUF4030 domain-containing protein n=1 Tax=Virgibacillus ndiopensis TaxID=2004408 RepID=UPI000C06DA28|nr:DUF4030 domain-containing protein [Virgibacillus ndiopensis]
MDKMLKKMKEYYNNNYFTEETSDRIKKRVLNEIRNKKVKMSIGKKVMYFSSVAVLIIGLLIGSAFASPTVANVLAKVPILNALFEKEQDIYPSIVGMITDHLRTLDYNIVGGYLRVHDKKIGVRIGGTDKYFNEVKGKVEQEITEILQDKELDAYHVEVTKEKEFVREEISEKQKKKIEAYMQQSQKLEEEILKALNNKNYEILSAHVRINDVEKFIPLEIPVSETREDEMKQIVKDIVQEKDMDKFTIKVYKTDPEKEKADRRWRPVITTISEGLIGMKELKVEGVGYSFYPFPLTISIRTSVESSDSNARELGKEIENKVRHFIESEEVKENVKDDPYNINVYSKDKEKIN